MTMEFVKLADGNQLPMLGLGRLAGAGRCDV